MIISTEADLKVLNTLSENCFDYFSMYELAKKSGLSHTWIYKVIEKLNMYNLIIQKNKKVKINFESELAVRFKKIFDLEKIYETNLKEEIMEIFHVIIKAYADDLMSLCIIGSVARMKQKKGSDVDFLLITKKSKKQKYREFGLLEHENINIIELTKQQFDEKYLNADDFIVSALSYLLILFDNNFIVKYLQKPLPFPGKEIIRERIRQLDPTRERLITQLKIKDCKNMKKSLIELLVQLIRIKLLQNQIIPKSKHELTAQIRQVDGDKAKDLGMLLKNELPKKKIINMAEKYGFKNYRSV